MDWGDRVLGAIAVASAAPVIWSFFTVARNRDPSEPWMSDALASDLRPATSPGKYLMSASLSAVEFSEGLADAMAIGDGWADAVISNGSSTCARISRPFSRRSAGSCGRAGGCSSPTSPTAGRYRPKRCGISTFGQAEPMVGYPVCGLAEDAGGLRLHRHHHRPGGRNVRRRNGRG